MEEVPDEGDPIATNRIYHHHPTATQASDDLFGTQWADRRATDAAEGRDPWSPFESIDDWEYAKWLMTCGVSQGEIDKNLALNIVSYDFMQSSRSSTDLHLTL